MPEIVYRFTSIGADSVARQFPTIESAARKARDGIARSSRSAGDSLGAIGKAADKTAKQVEKAAQAEAKAVQRTADQGVKAFEKSEQQKTKALEKEAKARLRVEEKMQRDATRAMEKEARQQQQLTEKQNRAREKYQGQLASKRDGMLTSALGMGAGAAMAVGGLTVDALSDRLKVNDAARRLSINARAAGTAGVDPSLLQAEAESAARNAPGSKAIDILEAQQQFVAMTGDLDTARKSGGVFATASMASGASATDIAAMAGTFSQKFGITSREGMQGAIASTLFQGKQGAFELSDAASYYQKMGAAGSRFGLDKGLGGVQTLGGLAQMARASTGSGAEASTAVSSMLSMLETKSDLISKKTHGYAKVFTDKGKTKTNDIQDVLTKTISGTKGNVSDLTKIFGERGVRAASGMITAFNDAQNALGKGATEADKRAAGEAAIRKLMADNINATSSWTEVQKDAATAGKGAGATFTAVSEAFSAGIGSVNLSMEDFGGTIKMAAEAGEEIGKIINETTDNFAAMSAWMKRMGFLAEDPAEKTGGEKYGENLSELHDLDAKAKSGTMTNVERARKQKLERENSDILKEILPQSMPDLKKPTGPLSASDKLAMGNGFRNPFQGPNLHDLLGGGASLSGPGLLPAEHKESLLHTLNPIAHPLGGLTDALGGLARNSNDKAANNGAADTKAAAADMKAAAADLKAAAAEQKKGDPLGGNRWF